MGVEEDSPDSEKPLSPRKRSGGEVNPTSGSLKDINNGSESSLKSSNSSSVTVLSSPAETQNYSHNASSSTLTTSSISSPLSLSEAFSTSDSVDNLYVACRDKDLDNINQNCKNKQSIRSDEDKVLSHKINDSVVLIEPSNTSVLPTDEPSETTEFLPLAEIKRKMSHLPKRLPIDLEFSELTYCVENERKKGYKTILKGVSGKFKSGELNAIMGPSGAGKSTLMNVLAGYRTSSVSGNILVNGKQRNFRSFRKQSCYIMQEDHLLPFLSIQEYMDGAATLKLGKEVSSKAKTVLIEEILETLSLKDCRSTRVSNLSGGEKKRLSIALELVNNPPIMFFDEPTSGLDSQNSYHCINLLRSLAEEGRTIICTIHQPSARLFEKFDMLYALAEGSCIYRGAIGNLVPFMSSLALECPSYHNPADFLVEVASGEYGNFIPKLVSAVNCDFCPEVPQKDRVGKTINLDLVQPWTGTKSKEGTTDFATRGECVYVPVDQKVDLTACQEKFLSENKDTYVEYPASNWTQFSVLFKRTFLSIVRDMMLTKLRLAAHLIVGVFIGILYCNIGNEASKLLNNVGCIFFSIMFLLFTSMMPTILTFPLEMNVFIREHLNNWYSLKPYYLAKTMADVPFQIIFPILYVVIVYFMTDQPHEAQVFFLITAFCIMTSLVSQSIGLAIGAAFDVQQAVFFGPTVAIPALLFSGFFVSYSTIPIYLRWLTYLSFIKFAYEGSILTLYGSHREPLHCSQAFCMFKFPEKIREELDVKENFLWFDLFLLFLYFIVMRALGYFILRWKLRKER